MIGKLQGIVDHIGDGFVIIMVSGVGYKVFCPEYLTHKSIVSLWIETVVREDSIRLFGFTSHAQNELFNQLTSVSGVGPKVAMAILGTLKTDVLLSAIATGDAKTISAAPGVGKKVAEKIILELKIKIGGVSFDNNNGNNHLGDLLCALETLGYKRIDIIEIAQKLVNENPDFGVEKLVPLALKNISNK
ncbi:MAG: Holliday junction branch migration protein RuvA [Alphaproteobacteria bacterium]|nr:Holliday junction branch migration protein RuvA [Alphaproteobacteria bacterium]MBN2675606.1 Holliday junction branch migration protein RuvA [Alphaproteobacteria bacterium]